MSIHIAVSELSCSPPSVCQGFCGKIAATALPAALTMAAPPVDSKGRRASIANRRVINLQLQPL